MKKISVIFSMVAFSILLTAPPSMAAPAVAQSEKVERVEQLLKYLSYNAEGDGDKVIYILCGAQCPRCASMHNILSGNPDFAQYQFRWVLWEGSDPGYYFPLENKPGAGMKELYGDPGKIEPKPVDNPERLKTITKYNSLISGMARNFFSGNPSVNMTPFILIKTPDGFEYGSSEDFMGSSATTSFDKALPLAEGADVDEILKNIEDAEALDNNRQEFLADKKDVLIRLFPWDDAPLVDASIPEGYVANNVVSKTRNGWIGIRIFKNPDSPLAYVKLEDGVLQRK